MVRIEGGDIVYAHPFHAMLFAQFVVVLFDVDQGVVGNRDHTFTRVTVNTTESAYLTHIYIAHTGKFVEHAVGSFVDALIEVDEASVEPPFTTPRIHLTFADQDLEFVLVESENDTIDRYEDFCFILIETCHNTTKVWRKATR